jgi:hypothetical protein
MWKHGNYGERTDRHFKAHCSARPQVSVAGSSTKLHLSPARNRTPCQHERLRETPRRPVPGTTVPGQAAGGSGPLEMTQEATEDRLGGEGRDAPPGALLTPRAPHHGEGKHTFEQPGLPQRAETGLILLAARLAWS